LFAHWKDGAEVTSRSPVAARFTSAFVALLVVGTLAFGDSAALARPTFPSSPQLDNFAIDESLNPSWSTPALGEGAMRLDKVAHEFVGIDGHWDAGLWNTSFAAPVEVWATINRAGTNDANLYADVIGGASGARHAASGYFVDFGGINSGGSTRDVSLVRIDGPLKQVRLTFASSPFARLQAGDQIGLSISRTGVIIAWYKPVGGSWTAVVSWQDVRYRSGGIAIEAIPGVAYGFRNFGGGTPSTPMMSTTTKTAVVSSGPNVSVGQHVTYTATVSPRPVGGTVSFVDGVVPISGCGAQTIKGSGKAACTVTYAAPGVHSVSARYTGSPDGAFAGSINNSNALVIVSRRPLLGVGRQRLMVTVFCPAQSGGCRISSTVAIAVPGRRAVTLNSLSAKLKAAKAHRFAFVLDASTRATLRSYIRHHHHVHLGATVRLAIRDGYGTSGIQKLTYTVNGARDLAQLTTV
jgi:Bacterial Ig-like domain (group 3)